MTRIRTRTSSLVTATALGAVCALGGAGAASAQADPDPLLPGVGSPGVVVITDSPYVSVKVADHAAADSAVNVTFTNNYDHSFACFVPGASTTTTPAKLPGAVTEARLVADAVDYYRKLPAPSAGGTVVPVLGLLPTGSVYSYLPGILNSLLGKAISAQLQLRAAWDDAQIAGHTADIPAFTLAPRATHTVSAALGMPGNNVRTDFTAGALVYCTDTTADPDQAYVFAGYEGGAAPTAGGGDGGSLAAGSLRSGNASGSGS